MENRNENVETWPTSVLVSEIADVVASRTTYPEVVERYHRICAELDRRLPAPPSEPSR